MTNLEMDLNTRIFDSTIEESIHYETKTTFTIKLSSFSSNWIVRIIIPHLKDEQKRDNNK